MVPLNRGAGGAGWVAGGRGLGGGGSRMSNQPKRPGGSAKQGPEAGWLAGWGGPGGDQGGIMAVWLAGWLAEADEGAVIGDQ